MTGVTHDELEHLVLMATCAPSVHNTQPWRFVATDDGLALEVDRSRQLHVIDPEGRELLMSCGTVLHHLQVAARAIGVDARVELHPDSDEVAQVHLSRGAPATSDEVDAAVAILHRHTHRGRFDQDGVPGEVLDELTSVTTAAGAMLRVVRDDELVEVEVLASRAERALQQTPGYGEELADWVWTDEVTDRGDGLPLTAVDHGPDRAESLQGRQFDGREPSRPSEPPAPEHPAVVLLSTEADTHEDWLRAGMALSALLLRGTELGILAQPIGQVVDVPQARFALQQVLRTYGTPQMLLRLGRGVTTPVSPRRPVEELLRG